MQNENFFVFQLLRQPRSRGDTTGLMSQKGTPKQPFSPLATQITLTDILKRYK
jgi:hypothetical protein